jgi:integrase
VIRRDPRGDGTRLQVYGRRAGRKVYVGTYYSQRAAAEAEEDFSALTRAISRGEVPPEVNTSRTFTEAAKEWIASLRKAKRRCVDGYAKRVDIYLEPKLGTVPIARVTTGQVMALRDELAERLAPSTVNGNLIALSSAFTYFVKRQWVKTNPVHGVQPVEVPRHAYNWIHTREEMTRLLLACNDELRDIVATALGTGLRFDELLHLQWADIDLDRRLITVHRGKHGTVKSGKLRHVPILDSVLPMLKARALKRAGAVLVFPGEKGRVRSQKAVFTIYKLALTRAQLDKRLRFHDLRHTFASHWMMDGGCIFRLSKILGHSSVKITQDVYAHLAPQVWEQDYGRVNFHVPTERARIYSLQRDGQGRIVGRDVVVLSATA